MSAQRACAGGESRRGDRGCCRLNRGSSSRNLDHGRIADERAHAGADGPCQRSRYDSTSTGDGDRSSHQRASAHARGH